MIEKLSANLRLEELLTRFVAWLPAAVSALVLFLGFWLLYRLTRKPLHAILSTAGLTNALSKMLLSIYRVAVLVFGAIMAASQLGVDVGAALAGLGVAGLTIGFAAKDSLQNTIAGFLVFWDKPFQVGDWVSVSGQYGRVSEITMRTTRIRTLNNTFVIIPNQTMIDEVLVNHSKHGETRVDIPIGIAYKEQIPAARKVLLEAIEGLDDVLEQPAPTVVVTGLGASSVDLEVRVWIGDAAHEKPVLFRVAEAGKIALDEAGIEIPFPHLQLFVDDVAGTVLDKTAAAFGKGSENGNRKETAMTKEDTREQAN